MSTEETNGEQPNESIEDPVRRNAEDLTSGTTGDLVSVREAARRLVPPVTHPTILNWLRAGHVQERGTQKNLDGPPSRLVDMAEVAAYHEQSRQSRTSLVDRTNAERTAGIPPVGTPVSQSEAARICGVTPSLVSTWAKKQEIVVLQYPDGPGSPMLVDLRSVWERMKSYRPKTRNGQRRMTGIAQPSPRRASQGRAAFPTPSLPRTRSLPHAEPTGWTCPECGAEWRIDHGSPTTE